jgi:hypothetical protein
MAQHTLMRVEHSAGFRGDGVDTTLFVGQLDTVADAEGAAASVRAMPRCGVLSTH